MVRSERNDDMKQEVKIAVVVVIYNEQIGNVKSYQSLLKYCVPEDVLIYDNSRSAQENPYGFHYLHDPSNPGVSKAYNYAASQAISKSYSHLLILDSDSEFPKDALETYRKAARKNPNRLILPQVVADGKVISPFWFKWGKSWYGEHIKEGKLEFWQIAAINSGTLIPLFEFEKTKGYDENIPLDWSDIAFCRQLGRLNIGGVKLPMQIKHDLSESNLSSWELAKFRFKTYMLGMKATPAKHLFEALLMVIWAKLKALKLVWRYKSFWFLLHYSRKLLNA